MINNSKKQKYDWSQDKIDLAKLDESNTEGMAKRMQGLEKSFKQDYAMRNNKDKKSFVPLAEIE